MFSSILDLDSSSTMPFSNLYFSYLKNHDLYNDLITNLKEKGYIKDIFYYPNKKD